MSTKAELQTIRDDNWGDTSPLSPSTPLRDPVCDRTVLDTIIANIYPTPVVETSASPAFTVANSNTNFPYTAIFTKIGRRIFVDISYRNASGSVTGAYQTLFTFDNSLAGELLPDLSTQFLGMSFGTTTTNQVRTKFDLSGSNIRFQANQIPTSSGSSDLLYLRFSYNARN